MVDGLFHINFVSIEKEIFVMFYGIMLDYTRVIVDKNLKSSELGICVKLN